MKGTKKAHRKEYVLFQLQKVYNPLASMNITDNNSTTLVTASTNRLYIVQYYIFTVKKTCISKFVDGSDLWSTKKPQVVVIF